MPDVSAILTAAGESTRMGRPKPLLPWHDVTLVEYQVESLSKAGVSQIVVVLGHESAAVAPFVNETLASYIVNADYRSGRTSSTKAGLSRVDGGADALLFLGVDQPRTPELIGRVVNAHLRQEALITSPRYRGRGGHPLVFSSSLKDELDGITEENQGVRDVFRRHRDEVNEAEIDDPMVRLDLNTPEDYERAKAVYGGYEK